MGAMGNIQGVIMRPLAAMLAIAVLFSGIGLLAGGTNSWLLVTYDVCKVSGNGERIDRLVFSTETEPDDAWFKNSLTEISAAAAATGGTTLATNEFMVLAVGNTGNNCVVKGTTTKTEFSSTAAVDGEFTVPSTLNVFTQGGTKLSISDADALEGVVSESFWSAGGLKQLVQLIVRAAALGIPLGCLVALAAFGRNFLSGMGMNPLMAVIVLIIAFSLLGALLDVLTPFISDAFLSINSDRYSVYDGAGISAIATVIGNFYGIVVIAGLLTVAWQVIGVFRSGANGGGGVLGGAGASGGYGRM